MTNTFPDPGLYRTYWKCCFILYLSFRKCECPPILLGTQGHRDVALSPKSLHGAALWGAGWFSSTLMLNLLYHTYEGVLDNPAEGNGGFLWGFEAIKPNAHLALHATEGWQRHTHCTSQSAAFLPFPGSVPKSLCHNHYRLRAGDREGLFL